MKVARISKDALHNIWNGNTTVPSTCVIKFYSNQCNYCHNLRDYYHDIADTYDDIYFFVFNVGDEPGIETKLKFNGVPTIAMVKTDPPRATTSFMADPDTPNKLTWYMSNDIKNFIEETKNE